MFAFPFIGTAFYETGSHSIGNSTYYICVLFVWMLIKNFNIAVLPLSVLMSPMFDKTVPSYLHYATIGKILKINSKL